MTTAEINAGIEQLLKVLTSGKGRVRFSDGREADYRNPQQIRDAISLLQSLTPSDAPADTPTPIKQIVLYARDEEC